MSTSGDIFDAIIIGSGIGGLAAAAALAKCGRRVLVLEQHYQLGGLTQVFNRGGYRFASGVHYIGGVGEVSGPDGQLGRILGWLSDEQLRFANLGSPYDIVRLPGFEFPIEAPHAAYVARLKATFPGESAAIDNYFAACGKARKAAMGSFAAKAMPKLLAMFVRWLSRRRARRVLARNSEQAVSEIQDRRLASILMARWGDYGLPPSQAPLALHSLIMGSYSAGAYFPIGGPGKFAEILGQTITRAGGKLRTRARVAEIEVTHGRRRVAGVRLASGETISAPVVISAMGARNTVAALAPGSTPEWRKAVASLESGVSYVTLYLGFRGDIRRYGATPANTWIYEGEDIGRVWERPWREEAPSLFVSFPSLKDPEHKDGEPHTAEVIALCRWEAFAAWSEESRPGHRPADYRAAKAALAEVLLGQFQRHFPQLAPLVGFHEISTPLSQAAFVGADRGAMYGLQMTAERMLHPALNIRTPVPGLLLAGQDVISPGIHGAFMGGYMAAAVLEPKLWRQMSR